MTTLYVRDGDQFQEATSETVLKSAQGLIARRFRKGSPVVPNGTQVKEFLKLRLGASEHEIFSILFLTSRHTLIEYVELFRGTVNQSYVYPREVVKEALARNAAAIIVVHCHPSGETEPSTADEKITQRLKESLSLLDIRLLDHIIVAGDKTFSFSEHNML